LSCDEETPTVVVCVISCTCFSYVCLRGVVLVIHIN